MQLIPARFPRITSRLRRSAGRPLGRGLVVLCVGIAGAAAPARGQEQDAGYLFRFFNDADHVTVFSHFGSYQVNLEQGPRLTVHWDHERVVIPALEAPPGTPEAVDAITTASRPISNANDAYRDFTKVRNELQLDAESGMGRLGYYVSRESDYFAQQVRGGVNRDFLDRNLNLSVGGSYGWDAIEPLLDEDTATPSDSRTTWHGNLVVTQVLSPTTVLRVGGEVNLVQGLQHSPYRNVYAGGGPRPEVHPDRRNRQALFVQLSQYLRNRSSLLLDYRRYGDDWGVHSNTVGAHLTQYVTRDLTVGYRYRFYDQGAADFYRSEYEDPEGIDGHRTADYRLGAFRAHLFGVETRVNLGGIRGGGAWRRLDLQVSYERYFNSNNFSANIFESGLGYRF